MTRKKSQVLTEEEVLQRGISMMPLRLLYFIKKAVPGIVIPLLTPKKYSQNAKLIEIAHHIHHFLQMMYAFSHNLPQVSDSQKETLDHTIQEIRLQYRNTLTLFNTECSLTLNALDRYALTDELEKNMQLFDNLAEYLGHAVAIKNSESVGPRTPNTLSRPQAAKSSSRFSLKVSRPSFIKGSPTSNQTLNHKSTPRKC
jgi:hypothetical protein